MCGAVEDADVAAVVQGEKPLRRSSGRIWRIGLLPSLKLRTFFSSAWPSAARTMNHWPMLPLESPTISEMPPSSRLTLVISLPSPTSL